MTGSLKAVTAFSGALLLGLFLGAAPHSARAHADVISGMTEPPAQGVKQAPPPPDDPNRKKEGDECKSSEECQKHHTCAKVGDKKVCQAPPRPRLPPGAVT